MGRAFEFRKARKFKRWGNMARVFTKLGKELDLNRNTVATRFKHLQELGLVVAKDGENYYFTFGKYSSMLDK